METVVYLIKHRDTLTKIFDEYKVNETDIIKNEKQVLSISGEKQAEQLSKLGELQSVDKIYSSHYSRAISTAKYLAEKLDLKINVNDQLGERITGETEGSSPNKFYYEQFHNFDYKLFRGESINEVNARMNEIINTIVFSNFGNNIAIFTHGVSILSYLLKYCEVGYNLDDEIILTYKDKQFNKLWLSNDIIKLAFLDNELSNVVVIEVV